MTPTPDYQFYDNESERATLGACLLDSSAVETVNQILTSKDFYKVGHQKIYEALVYIRCESGKAADLITLTDQLRRSGDIETAGNVPYLAALTTGVPSSANVEYYAQIVKENSQRRALAFIADELKRKTIDPSLEIKEILTDVNRAIEDRVLFTSQNRKGFEFIKLSEIELVASEYLVDQILPVVSNGRIFGDTGTYKSFFAIDLACSIASNVLFHGRKVKQAPVFYIAGEGKAGIKRRFVAWCLQNNCDIKDLQVYVSNTSADMIDQQSVDDVILKIELLTKENGNPGLVILDTQARNFGPGDENKTADMNMYIYGCDRIKDIFSCSILSIHHTGTLDKTRARGSYANKCAMDFEYMCDRAEDDILRIVCTKMKEASNPDPMAYMAHPIKIGMVDKNGQPETSLVLEEIEYIDKPQKGTRDTGKYQNIMMAILKDAGEKGLFFEEWKKKCYDQGVDRRRFSENKKKWIEEGVILQECGIVFLAGGTHENI